MKIEIRTHCKVCGGKIGIKRFRTYCSHQCRTKFNNQGSYLKYNKNEGQRARAGAKVEGKIQCLLCLSWYWKVGAHIAQRHKMTAREYREEQNLEVKRGITPPHLRKIWGQNALDNKMDKQLIKTGAKTRFKKGQKGLGKYERSPVTMARLKILYKSG